MGCEYVYRVGSVTLSFEDGEGFADAIGRMFDDEIENTVVDLKHQVDVTTARLLVGWGRAAAVLAREASTFLACHSRTKAMRASLPVLAFST